MNGFDDHTGAGRGATGGTAADEPRHDPRLASALRHAAWMERDDLTTAALRHRIVAAAASRLAQRRMAEQPWWEFAAGWARAAIPTGLAAAALLGVVATQGQRTLAGTSPLAAVEGPAGAFVTAPNQPMAATVVMAAVITETESTDMMDELLGEPTHDAVLSQVLR